MLFGFKAGHLHIADYAIKLKTIRSYKREKVRQTDSARDRVVKIPQREKEEERQEHHVQREKRGLRV